MSSTMRLAVPPEWEQIEVVRVRTSDFLRQQGLNASAIDALVMVACELTENAVKYGYFEGEGSGIDVEIRSATSVVIVEIRSPTQPAGNSSENLRRLDRTIQWIRGFQDPFEAYLERLREVSAQRLDHSESGLGLVRIAYEGQSVLDFYVDEQNVLAVSAVYHS